MKLVLLSVGQHKDAWFTEVSDVYSKKISRMVEFKINRLKAKSGGRGSHEHKKSEECSALLAAIDPRDYVILCDERGKAFDSIQMSKKLVKGFESGSARVVFVVGGAYGADPALKDRANLIVSLSKMTFNHLVAQVVVLEQIYRSLTLWKGIPYHNE